MMSGQHPFGIGLWRLANAVTTLSAARKAGWAGFAGQLAGIAPATRPAWAIGGALVITAVAFTLAFRLQPVFEDAPLPLFLAAVAISASTGGVRGGLLGSFLGCAALVYFFDLWNASTLLQHAHEAFHLVLFVLTAWLITWLSGRLQSSNQRLEAARANADAAVRARDQILSFAAHDLRTPLCGISAAAQLARRRAAHSLNSGLLEHLADIERAAMHMDGMLGDIVDAAQLQTGQPIPLRRHPTRLLQLAREAVRRQTAVIDTHRVRVVAHGDPVGEWDAARLARVFDNLLSNAIKYSPAGGEITVEVDDQRPNEAIVRVRDHGIGIPADDLERIFDTFGRAGNVSDISGLGLGLAGARQIIEQHGGTLDADSVEGAGTTFTVRLPAGATSSGDESQAGASARFANASPSAPGRNRSLRGSKSCRSTGRARSQE